MVVALFETPNRLLPWDHHTTTTPFFHLLLDDLALEWLPRVRRKDIADGILGATDEAERRLLLTRAGRAVSFRELDVAWPDGWTALDGGYDPALGPIRLVLPRSARWPVRSSAWASTFTRRSPATGSTSCCGRA